MRVGREREGSIFLLDRPVVGDLEDSGWLSWKLRVRLMSARIWGAGRGCLRWQVTTEKRDVEKDGGFSCGERWKGWLLGVTWSFVECRAFGRGVSGQDASTLAPCTSSRCGWGGPIDLGGCALSPTAALSPFPHSLKLLVWYDLPRKIRVIPGWNHSVFHDICIDETRSPDIALVPV